MCLPTFKDRAFLPLLAYTELNCTRGPWPEALWEKGRPRSSFSFYAIQESYETTVLLPQGPGMVGISETAPELFFSGSREVSRGWEGKQLKVGRGCGGSASGLDPLGALAGKGRRKSGDNVLGGIGDSRNEEVCCPSGKQLTTVASPLSGPRRAGAGAGPLPWDSHQQGSKGGGRAGSGHGVPPPKGKRFPPHICATVDLSEQLVVKEKVIDEDAA